MTSWWARSSTARPGPKQEMRVEDPDGYVLMIAQIEDDRLGRHAGVGT